MRLANLCMIAAFTMGGLAACNNASDNSAANSTPATDTSMYSTSGGTAAPAATSATPATTAKAARKKGKASIMLPAGNNDKMEKDREGVYNRAQVMPEFPGGQPALATYVNDHLTYPQQAIDDNTDGTVKVSFVVDEKGKVTGARLLNGTKLGKGLDEEALKVVTNMPAWKPGKVNGKNVKTRLELPIAFQLES